MQRETEKEFIFIAPVARAIPTREAVTYPLDRPAFLRAAETVIPQLVHPATGRHWEFDGYRRTQLFLVQPPHLELGLSDYTVEFELDFGKGQTTVAVSTLSPHVQQLFHQFTRELTLWLLKERTSN